MSSSYKINNPDGIYFLSFATVGWIDVFTRNEYKEVLVDSLKYCQKYKGLEIYSWVVMSNHVHLVVSSKKGDLSGTLRDFKKFTASELIRRIKSNTKESRRDWMLHLFSKYGTANSQNKNYQFWRQDNQPKELLRYANSFAQQKINYIHNNPVVAGIVDEAKHYLYSSARDYCGEKGLIDIIHFE
ncbi:MAG: transposase [Bacteroidetes bacterium]|nr:transposase [Bacteroidota bacterium]